MITLVTINFNNASGLYKTLNSVAKQENPEDFEYLIIDGASTDGSVDLIRSYANYYKLRWISERDEGIYDAMNKGLELARNRYVAFINSGDIIDGSDKLKIICSVLRENIDLDILYSNVEIIRQDETILRKWTAGKYSKIKLYFGWMPPHPMIVINKTLIDLMAGFDLNYKIAADYHLMLKIFLKCQPRVKYLNLNTVKMEAGGISNGSLATIINSNLEVISAWISIRGLLVPYWIFISKPLLKIFQLFGFQSRRK